MEMHMSGQHCIELIEYWCFRNVCKLITLRNIALSQGLKVFSKFFNLWVFEETQSSLSRQSQEFLRSKSESTAKNWLPSGQRRVSKLSQDLEDSHFLDIVKEQLLVKGVLRSVVNALPYMKEGVHSKILKLEHILTDFFGTEQAKSQLSKVLVFVGRRKVASELVSYLNRPSCKRTPSGSHSIFFSRLHTPKIRKRMTGYKVSITRSPQTGSAQTIDRLIIPQLFVGQKPSFFQKLEPRQERSLQLEIRKHGKICTTFGKKKKEKPKNGNNLGPKSNYLINKSQYEELHNQELPEYCPGMNQDLQKKAVQKLKNHKINTLIATCIAEEGLDFGEIDLIICYDASGLNPVRMMQRFGRTGRKRAGRVIMFLDEREIKIYEQNDLAYQGIAGNLSWQSFSDGLRVKKKGKKIQYFDSKCEKRKFKKDNQYLRQFRKIGKANIMKFKMYCYGASMWPDNTPNPTLKYVGEEAETNMVEETNSINRQLINGVIDDLVLEHDLDMVMQKD